MADRDPPASGSHPENRAPDLTALPGARPLASTTQPEAVTTWRPVEVVRPSLWKPTWSGRCFPLTGFGATDIDLFGDMPETLARICRYGGAVPGNPFSVAQHSVIGARAALEETGDAHLAAHVLLHDGHEYIVGDLTTPIADWWADLAVELFGPLAAGLMPQLIAAAKHRLDLAIWKAAGLTPPGQTYRRMIAEYDLRLLATEQRQLLNRQPKSWGMAVDQARPIRLRGRLTAWTVERSVGEFRDLLETLCPDAMRL